MSNHSEGPAIGALEQPGSKGSWYAALLIAAIGLVPLTWLLARLIWLPLYMGLFFFIIAGLLVGAATFRLARRARPVARWQIIRGSTIVALVGGAAFIEWEYRYFATTIGQAPRFAEAKNAALARGDTARSVESAAAAEFRGSMTNRFAPGGAIGYFRWAVSSQPLPLVVDSARETITMPHAGFRWVVRTACAIILLGLGVYLSFDALRSDERVSNILRPGEPYDEEV